MTKPMTDGPIKIFFSSFMDILVQATISSLQNPIVKVPILICQNCDKSREQLRVKQLLEDDTGLVHKVLI